MKKIEVGDSVPNSKFESTHPNISSFADLAGKKLVIYFYPKDNTPGCTLQGKDFTTLYPEFKKLNAEVIGVSRDSPTSHEKFCSKYGFPFPLISDQDESLCRQFGVLIEKNMFKRLLIGIDRSTFLIDEKGVIQRIWRHVKAKGHAQEVLSAMTSNQSL